MKEIIKDLRIKLEHGFFEKEEHVRIGIVTRICQALGWDIWNPQEFYSEFPIKMKGRDGSVDVALFHSNLKDRTPDVFIEIKAVGKLRGNIESSEEQLQEYNFYNTASITILTDGKIWRFYLSSASGTFAQKLFCSLNLSDDEEDYIIYIFQNILAKGRFARDAINSAEQMLSDLRLSREIERAKKDANQKSDMHPDLNKFQLVQLVLKERGRKFDIEEIKRLWEPKSAQTTDDPQTKIDTSRQSDTMTPPTFVRTIGGLKDDYTCSKITRVFIIDQWYDVQYWWQAKKPLYERFYDKLRHADLPKRMRILENKEDHNIHVTLAQGTYIEGHGKANTLIKDMITVLSFLGYNPETNLKIEYIPNASKKRGKK